ncbi:MAG: IS3 family transposase [Pseudomonadota bacterium]
MVTHGLSIKRSCALTGIERSSFYYKARPRDDTGLGETLKAISVRHKRYGYRRAHALILRSGKIVNHKRVYRLWRLLGLCLPRKRPKKKRKRRDPIPMTAECPNHVWTYDFIFDALANGRRLKIMTLEDEYTREGLAIKADKSFRARDVVCTLAGLFSERGAPMYIRSDNGPEFVEKALKRWLASQGTDTIHIEPGKPWQNGFIESFNSRVRDEFLNMEVFYTLKEAQIKAEMWRQEYNRERPHSSLSYQTPVEYRDAFFSQAASAMLLEAHPPV